MTSAVGHSILISRWSLARLSRGFQMLAWDNVSMCLGSLSPSILRHKTPLACLGSGARYFRCIPLQALQLHIPLGFELFPERRNGSRVARVSAGKFNKDFVERSTIVHLDRHGTSSAVLSEPSHGSAVRRLARCTMNPNANVAPCENPISPSNRVAR